MSNNGADIYLVLLRPTRVPVLGEAVSQFFQGQILVESLSWKLHNEEERKNASKEDAAFNAAKQKADQRGSNGLRAIHALTDDHEKRNKQLTDSFQKLQRSGTVTAADWKTFNDQHAALARDMDRKIQRALASPELFAPEREAAKADKPDTLESVRKRQYDDLERNRNFEFTFTKRVDIASTQMLNSMKAGDVFPSATLTIHKRSATVLDGTSLVFTIQKVRLLDYEIEVAVTDTMTEMMEKWTCEFGSLAYVYKNPPSHYSHGNAGQAAAKAVSQGTTRAFTMKNIGSPI